MGFPQSSRAYADLDKPRSWGTCDRCNFRYLREQLQFQWDYRGLSLANLRILVCDICLDEPQSQLRPVIIGPDPVPIIDPRPGWLDTQQGYTPVFDLLEIIDGDILPPPPGGGPTPPIPPTPGGLAETGGFLYVTDPTGWPTDPTGLPAGSLWTNGMFISVVGPTSPNPEAAAVFFGVIGAAGLLALGGSNLPLTDPAVLNQIFIDGGFLAISFGTGQPPAAPTGLMASSILSTSVTLTWTEP